MFPFRFIRNTALMVACSVAAACGDGTGPQDVSVDDVLADVSAGQSFAASGIGFLGATALPQPAAMHHANCAFSSGTFVCPTATVNGITFNRSFQLLDASGTPQAAFDRATTAAVRTVTDVSGRITSTTDGTTRTVDITAHQDATLSGLLTGTHVLNASGTGNAAITGGGLNHSLATAQTVTNLELPRRDSETRYPKSGVVATQAVLTGPGFSNTMTVTLTFDGSSTATLVITNMGITRTCKIDLSQSHAAPDCTT